MKTTLLIASFLALTVAAGAQRMPAGITRTQLLDNASVMVARLRMAPGAREEVHTHPFSAVVVQLDPGEVEMRLGTRRETTRQERGHVEFIAAEIPHAAANVGAAPFDLVTIALKPDRTPGGEQPPSQAPAGITRQLALDNAQARATRVTFGPGSRETTHTHPYDLVLVHLTPGRMELQIGDKTDVRHYSAGDVAFIPRDVPHAAASADTRAFEIVSIGVK
jgi:quercetin dioxygenase-like cupin family protein